MSQYWSVFCASIKISPVCSPVSVHLGVVLRLSAAQRHVLSGEAALHLGTVNAEDLGADSDVMFSVRPDASLHLELPAAGVEFT